MFGAGALVIGLLAPIGCAATTSADKGSAPGTTTPGPNKAIVENDEAPVSGGTLAYGLIGETNGWNPASNQWAAPGLIVSRAIFDTITAYDDQSQIKPFLAESFDHNTDFTEWTFKLRSGVKLHNGKPVTADTVVRNQTFLMKSPITGGAYTYAGITGFSKQDDVTFKVTLSRPFALLPIIFSTQLGVVADPDWLETFDGLHPIGTGPFTFDTWEVGNQLKAKKNKDYWRTDTRNNRLPYLDNVTFKVIPDSNSRAKALKAGDVDVIEANAGPQIQEFQADGNYQVFADAKGETAENFVMLNMTAAPFTDPDVRHALALATDKQAYSEIVSQGYYAPTNGIEAADSPWYTDTEYPQFDLEKAKALVSRVKARGGSVSFTILTTPDPALQAAVTVLQQQWAEAGFDVKIELKEVATLIIAVVQGGYQAVQWTQFAAPNPYADGVWIDPKGAVAPPTFSLNFARNKDDAIGEALNKGFASPDPAVQKAQWAIIQQRLTADLPYIWLTTTRDALIANKRVVNLTRANLPDGTRALLQVEGAHQLAQIWLKD